MSERTALLVTDRTQVENRAKDESVWSKLAREAYVLGAGVAVGIKDGVKEIVDDPAPALGRLAIAGGIGMVLGATQRTAGLARLGLEAAGVGMGLAFYRDIVHPQRWSAVRSALSDAWQSDANTDRSVKLIGNSLGRMVFDTALMTGATLGAAKLSQKYLSFNPGEGRLWEPSHMSSYDRMLMEKASRVHPYEF
ncbi:MAG TPA: hypothetical protein V6D08_12195 [Candidatus Obscuribacterales bacterium]